MKGLTTFVVGALAAKAFAFPSSMLQSLDIDADVLEKFEAVQRDNAEAERLFQEHQARRAEAGTEHTPDVNENVLADAMNPIKHLLTHGGGLNLNGGFRKFTGALSAIELPSIQPQGLKVIPGDDPAHQFQSPGPTDVRGMCPTLNTLANHGYVDRSGISSFAELTNAIQTGYGFTFSLSAFLSALGLLAGGDLPSGKYSIGGADDRVPNSIGPALGLDSHGVFEIDGSITRQDTYYGNSNLHNNANFLEKRWKEYVAISKKHGGLFNIETQAEDNGFRYDVSRATNPEFFAGGIWFAVSHAERVFVYTGLANGTTPNNANLANVAPFFLDERFPENWFRRGNAFPLALAFQQAGAMFLRNPRALGQNNGVGNFEPAGLDLDLKDPASTGCFLIKNIFDLAPKQLTNAFFANQALYKAFVAGAMLPFFTNDGFFNCNITEFTIPSASAVGSGTKSASSLGSPKGGKYDGIGFIKPDQKGGPK